MVKLEGLTTTQLLAANSFLDKNALAQPVLVECTQGVAGSRPPTSPRSSQCRSDRVSTPSCHSESYGNQECYLPTVGGQVRYAASSSPSCRSRAPQTRSHASAICAKTALGRTIRCPRPCSRSSRQPVASFAHRPIVAYSSWPTRAW